MPRAASDGRNLSCALPNCLHHHTTGDRNAALPQLPWSLSSPCPSVRQEYSMFVLQYLLEALGETACRCAGCFMHVSGRDSIFPKETTIYEPRHTEEGPLSLFWQQRTDAEATSTYIYCGWRDMGSFWIYASTTYRLPTGEGPQFPSKIPCTRSSHRKRRRGDKRGH